MDGLISNDLVKYFVQIARTKPQGRERTRDGELGKCANSASF
jgi:hypothetical protein